MKTYILPVRDLVVQPGMTIPVFTDNQTSVKIIEAAAMLGKHITLAAQRVLNYPARADEIFNVGTCAEMYQVLHLPDGTIHMLGRTTAAVRLENIHVADGIFTAEMNEIPQIDDSKDEKVLMLRDKIAADLPLAMRGRRVILDKLEKIMNDYPMGAFIDAVVQFAGIEPVDSVPILEMSSFREKLTELARLVGIQAEMSKLDNKIDSRISKEFNESRREYFLRQRIAAMQKELGEVDEEDGGNLKKKIEKLPKDARDKAMQEWKRMQALPPMSSEGATLKTYIEEVLAMPWEKSDKPKIDLAAARAILDEDHTGLDIAKERVLEHLAVMRKTGKNKGTILCFVGAPGVGKTSLGKSIARALGRKYQRISLGGVSDEAHFRGHRKTYVASQPGRIMDALKRCGANNPVIVLDEIDKLGRDHRGDPESALLEILDPEQNKTFRDHYLELDFDLSNVIFIATANSLNMSQALKDRMEIVQVPSYSEEEKIAIARNHLLRRAAEDTGWLLENIEISDETIRHIVRNYTAEEGVRELQRALISMLRRTLLQNNGEDTHTAFTIGLIDELLKSHKSAALSKRIGFVI